MKNKQKKIYEKESQQRLFQQLSKVLHEWPMHNGKNMMLCEWCHEHSLGAIHKSAFAISSSNLNLKYDSVVADEKSSLLCHSVFVCHCQSV